MLTAHVLLGWLFALAAGIAGACILERPPVHAVAAHQAHGARVADEAAASPSPEQHRSSADGHAPHGSDPDCLKSCDERSSALLAAKQQIDEPHPTAALPLQRDPWPLQPLSEAERSGADRAVVHPRLPVRIAYLRLAL